MFLFGICKYSGGGMRLTKDVKINDGLFDISYIENIELLTVIFNIFNLFNGKITNHKLVKTYKSNEIDQNYKLNYTQLSTPDNNTKNIINSYNILKS